MYRTVTSFPARITTRSSSFSVNDRARAANRVVCMLEAVEHLVGIGVVVALVPCDRVGVGSSELGAILVERPVGQRAVVANRVAEVRDVLERRPHTRFGLRAEASAVITHRGECLPVLRTEGVDEIGRLGDGEVLGIEPALRARRAHRVN